MFTNEFEVKCGGAKQTNAKRMNELGRAVRSGNVDCMDELFELARSYAIFLAKKNGANQDNAEDIAQEAMLQLFPLDTYAKPVYLMEKVPGDTVETPIWDTYAELIAPYTDEKPEMIERFAFYERAKKAYCVIQTGESALYANVILKKGVVTD